MADPFTLATVGIGASAAGGGISTLGSILSGSSKSAMYKYQAGVALTNAKIAKQNADYALATGEIEARNYGMRSAQQAGAIKAGQGASGIDVGSGSAVDVQKSQKMVSNIDMAQIRENAARKAYGYQIAGAQDVAQAGAFRTAASDATRAGYIGAASSLLSAAGSVSSKWLQASTMGIPGYGGNSGIVDEDEAPGP